MPYSHPDPHFPKDWAQLYAFYAGRLKGLLDSVLLLDLEHELARDTWYVVEEEFDAAKAELLQKMGAELYDSQRRA